MEFGDFSKNLPEFNIFFQNPNWILQCQHFEYILHFSSVSTVDIEQVNVS